MVDYFKHYQTRSKPPKNGKYPVSGDPYETEERHSKEHPEDCDCEWMLVSMDAEKKNGKIVADKSEAFWMSSTGESCMDTAMKSMQDGLDKFNEIKKETR